MVNVAGGPGIDGFYHLDGYLRMLQGWGLVEVIGVDVLEEVVG